MSQANVGFRGSPLVKRISKADTLMEGDVSDTDRSTE